MASLTPVLRARKILERLGYPQGPICLTDVCDMLGISVRYENCIDKLEAFLTINRKLDRALIMVNESKPYHRQRFNLAHEIAHAGLGHGPIAFSDEIGRKRVPWQEVHANRFAGELLMPKMSLIGMGTYLTPQLVSKHFHVSEDAARIRLERLGWL